MPFVHIHGDRNVTRDGAVCVTLFVHEDHGWDSSIEGNRAAMQPLAIDAMLWAIVVTMKRVNVGELGEARKVAQVFDAKWKRMQLDQKVDQVQCKPTPNDEWCHHVAENWALLL